jgi:hypothetical protein
MPRLSNRSQCSPPPRLPSRTVQAIWGVGAAVAVGHPSRSSHSPRTPEGVQKIPNPYSPSSHEVRWQMWVG